MGHPERLQKRFFRDVDLFSAVCAALIAYRARRLASGLAAGLTFSAADIAFFLHAVADNRIDMFHVSSYDARRAQP